MTVLNLMTNALKSVGHHTEFIGTIVDPLISVLWLQLRPSWRRLCWVVVLVVIWQTKLSCWLWVIEVTNKMLPFLCLCSPRDSVIAERNLFFQFTSSSICHRLSDDQMLNAVKTACYQYQWIATWLRNGVKQRSTPSTAIDFKFCTVRNGLIVACLLKAT